MAITKLGESILSKITDPVNFLTTNEEKDALRRHYGLDPDANTFLRGALRSNAGALAGTLPGLGLLVYGAKKWNPKLMELGTYGLGAGMLAGGIGAGYKYSRANAKDIMRREEK